MRLIAAFLCVLVAGSAFGQPGSEKAGVSGKSAAGVPEPLTLRIVSRPSTLTHWVAMARLESRLCASSTRMRGATRYSEKTGIAHRLLFIPPSARSTSNVNLTLASGDLRR